MNNACRICWQNSSYNMHLQAESKCKNLTLLQIYIECTQLEAKVDDELPQQLCALCSVELQFCYEFLCKARESDYKLRQQLSTGTAYVLEENSKNLEEDVATIELSSTLPTDIDPLSNFRSETGITELSTENLINVQLETPVSSVYTTEQTDADNFLCANNAENLIFPLGDYKCEICSAKYFTSKGLEVHMDIHLQGNNKNKKTKYQTNQTKNQRIKRNVASYKEESDNSAVAQTENRVSAKKTPKPKKLYPCKICAKPMISASKLRYHMVMHTGEKDYLCTICPKAYSTIYALKYHMRTHTGERPYECKFCGDKFLRPTTLKSHMRRHTGERPYGCNICGKRFIQHSSMTTHIKLNHMAKTIPCPHCDKKYARKTDLSTHLLSHTGDKPFSCTLCASRFIRQANLNKHMNQHHTSNKPKAKKSKQQLTNHNNTEINDSYNLNTFSSHLNELETITTAAYTLDNLENWNFTSTTHTNLL